ncbi:pirin family protein [Methylocystis bryophila]|uniref:Quercetin 2,3-dioxygenase n=1 Tax=Methylocystis bryophila TaxID=655015 RepID=A0A1W6MYX9_9HYPH|nr:pirin family protein [Methylocystis bryophila]ARN82749.1 quercetin 2,3-dioxygenase [Methylocystis bryophila]BDV38986.1 quercetin 2,3-dioxygenase [Methylocystis bryophila]
MRQTLAIFGPTAPHWVGDGFFVETLLSPQEQGQSASPFLLLDYAAPRHFAPTAQQRGVGEHPHRGFETVTIVFAGEVAHRDSTGAGGVIDAGDVQWMTAGSGILHEEFHSQAFAKSGGEMEMAQLWVNLPAKDKSAKPRYQTLSKAEIPTVELPDGAGVFRVIAGACGGVKGPAQTFTELSLLDARLGAGKRAVFDVPDGHTVSVLLRKGAVALGDEARLSPGQVAVLSREGGSVAITAEQNSELLLLSGKPIGEPIAAYGPFVMNTEAEIRQAISDFRAGRFGAGLPA